MNPLGRVVHVLRARLSTLAVRRGRGSYFHRFALSRFNLGFDEHAFRCLTGLFDSISNINIAGPSTRGWSQPLPGLFLKHDLQIAAFGHTDMGPLDFPADFEPRVNRYRNIL